MNSQEITEILKNHNSTHKTFVGCYPSDLIPKISTYPFCCVVNLDEATKPGSHWVALYSPSKNSIEYFDSYGLKPTKNIQKYLDKFPKIIVSNIALQDIFSDACGHFAIYFLRNRTKGKTFEEIIKKLSIIQKNDEHVKKYVRRLYFDA